MEVASNQRDDDGQAVGGPRRQPEVGEWALQKFGNCGPYEESHHQRGDRDAELGPREMEGKLLESLENADGLAIAVLGLTFDLGAIDGDDAELTGDEESVSEDEKQNGGDA